MNQFAPLDLPSAMDAFLGYWKPSAIILLESELWPNLIVGAARNGVSFSHFQANVLFIRNSLIITYNLLELEQFHYSFNSFVLHGSAEVVLHFCR